LGAFSPLALRRTGYQAYLAMLRACFAHGGGVRIDHVLGLNRLWLLPQGADAGSGAYVRYPLQDMLRLIALESWRHRAVVIGEDLGTVPPGFGDILEQSGVAGIRVLWFQRDQQGFLPPSAWPAHAIAVTTTHDLPTVAGWWSGVDLAWRDRLGQLDRALQQAQAQRERDREQLWQSLVEQDYASGPLPRVAAPSLEENTATDEAQAADPCAIAVDAALEFVAATPAALADTTRRRARPGPASQPAGPDHAASQPASAHACRYPATVCILCRPRPAGAAASRSGMHKES
jgi:4-alpha-glucanotransferase